MLEFLKILIYQCKLHQKRLSCLNEVGKSRLKFPVFSENETEQVYI